MKRAVYSCIISYCCFGFVAIKASLKRFITSNSKRNLTKEDDFLVLNLLLPSSKRDTTKKTDADSWTDLQLKADEHDQEDKTETEDTDGQADQPPE